jgi:SAM-dependent methyltransferase
MARALRTRFHDGRARVFEELMRPGAGMSILDLGGSDGSFSQRIASRLPVRVTVADVLPDNREAAIQRGFEHVLLDEGGALPFADRQFDIVLCNSVIEHVSSPGATAALRPGIDHRAWRLRARSAQKAFANEIRRVGRGYFVQTPHRSFPVEQHVHLPFVQYLSHRQLVRLVKLTDRFWIKYCGIVDWELFTPEELRALFPDADVTVERFMGLPKSIIAWKQS